MALKKEGVVVVSRAQRNSNKMRAEKRRLNLTIRSPVLRARVVPVEFWRWVANYLGGEAEVIEKNFII